jgi:hypothetical protein
LIYPYAESNGQAIKGFETHFAFRVQWEQVIERILGGWVPPELFARN